MKPWKGIIRLRLQNRKFLSVAGEVLANRPSRVDMEVFLEASQNKYHPADNPGGAFLLNVAENNVASELIQAKIKQILSKESPPRWVLNYTDPKGHPEVRQILAGFMQNYFHSSVDEDSLVLTAGASAALEIIGFSLANPGDFVVIPAPAYPMYSHDFGVKAKLKRYDLVTHKHLSKIDSAALVDIVLLEKTKKKLKRKSGKFKLLLITSPDNPTGSEYTEAQLRTIADWCIKHKVHLIVNEIYRLSKIDDPHANQRSFAALMDEYQSNYLHLLYAMSKDFSMSGMRVGVIHSRNQALIKALMNLNIQHMVSNLTQWTVAKMLNDHEFVDYYVAENQKRISESYRLTASYLDSLNVPYIVPDGGLFIWADFSSFMKKGESEMDFWMQIYRQTGVLLTPGEGFGHRKKGLFRIVFTGVPKEHLKAGMDKLSDYLKSIS